MVINVELGDEPRASDGIALGICTAKDTAFGSEGLDLKRSIAAGNPAHPSVMIFDKGVEPRAIDGILEGICTTKDTHEGEMGLVL